MTNECASWLRKGGAATLTMDCSLVTVVGASFTGSCAAWQAVMVGLVAELSAWRWSTTQLEIRSDQVVLNGTWEQQGVPTTTHDVRCGWK